MKNSSKVFFFLLMLILICPQPIYASANSQVSGELRGAWISTVYNIDWPSKSGLSVDKQQQEYITMLDKLKAMGINTVFVQVRAASDAIYPSNYVPWARSLTGVEGKNPGYDPLKYMIAETKKRGMEFHAWFNPFRAGTSNTISSLSFKHPARTNPQWVISHENKLIFDPGNREVRQHIINAIMEVVQNYDVDGIHLDDYFYPYGSVPFNDQETFSMYKGAFVKKADWRRHNINEFVKELSKSIKNENSTIKFGISPFGIWRNKGQDSTGSATNGNSAYDNQFADARTWINKGWVDYIAPQLYWSVGFKPADYKILVSWWANEVKGTQTKLYIGHAAYKLGTNNADWGSSNAIIQQLKLNQQYSEVAGSIFFSAKTLTQNKLGIEDALSKYYRF
ncbi:glycoside hydrolase family 10 protein [Paenibacillus donghaensis]|uniref:Glycosyl hydrolase-like 10 domain-containing protein n=1 Tax=Paenibacillus donghaensis TaxID=414771 RepID=A0A2Z2K5I2_9BACL|nr:family 10 glycosylhydrolase [Paenibacillus donghaensis]ASA19804.1 hypothetical protein B9T62_02660 [Paenibacillus donghaensis]